MSKVITINVINVGDVQKVPTAKGFYSTVEIAYKESGKVGGKKLVDFANQPVFQAALELKQGDFAEVVLEKEAGNDGREYWQWKQVTKVVAPATPEPSQEQEPVKATANTTVPAARPAGKVTGSNYETADERAVKQVYIVRQSSITAALKIFELRQIMPSSNEVIQLAEYLKEYVFNGSKEEGSKVQKESPDVRRQDRTVGQGVKEVVPVSQVPVKRKPGRPAVVPKEEEDMGLLDGDPDFFDHLGNQ